MTTPAQRQSILRRLICAFLDDPDSLEVVVDGSGTTMEFIVVNVAAEDRGKLIGRDGSHMRALAFIAQDMGERCGQNWVLRGQLPPPEKSRLASARPEDARRPERHSSLADEALFSDVVTACLETAPAVVVRKVGEPGDRNFTVAAKTRSDDALLNETSSFHRRETSLINELSTAFRAIGRRQGVNYRVVSED